MKTAVDRQSRTLPALAFLLALGVALWRIPQPGPAELQAPRFSAEQTQLESRRAAAALKLPTPDETALTRTADGRLALAWLAPSRDDPEDAAIWLSLQDRQGQWRAPLEIASRGTTAGGSFAFVKRIGSPALHAEGSWLHLWYLGHALGDWGATALYHSVSTDDGKTWTLPRRLSLVAGIDFGQPRLLPPLPLADGGLALPLTGSDGKLRYWLRFSATGRLLDRVDAAADDPLLNGRSQKLLEIPR